MTLATLAPSYKPTCTRPIDARNPHSPPHTTPQARANSSRTRVTTLEDFLGATKHLYNWLCPLVGRSVGRLVCLSVTHSFDDPHVAPYWPTWPCYKNSNLDGINLAVARLQIRFYITLLSSLQLRHLPVIKIHMTISESSFSNS